MNSRALSFLVGLVIGNKLLNPLIHVTYITLCAGAYFLGKHFA